MAAGRLLDANIISASANPDDPRYSQVRMKLNGVCGGPVMLPVIAIAEVEFGMLKADHPDIGQQQAMRKFFADFPLHLGVDDDTIEPYSLLRAKIWQLYGTPKRRGHAEKLPEQLKDRVTGEELGIDERDLLIASIAIQYRLVLVTNDKNAGMRRIEEAARQLAREGKPIILNIEYW